MKINYTISLLTSTTKKNFEQIALNRGVSADTIQRELDKNPIESKDILSFAKAIFGDKPIRILLDDSLSKKEYAKCIEGTQINFDSSKRKYVNSFCIVTVMLSDGITSIPVAFKLWVSCNKTKKYEIAQQLICELQDQIKIEVVLADGLYATKKMILWLNEKGISFEMRFHSNRVISNASEKAQVREFKNLKPRGKKHSKTIKAVWYDIDLYITAIKYFNADGSIKFSYQVSNYKATSTHHAQTYKMRWPIEMFFRTAKQSLGLQDCLSRKWERQKQHFLHVFLAYAILQYQVKQKSTFRNPETALRHFRSKSSNGFKYVKDRLDRIFGQVYA